MSTLKLHHLFGTLLVTLCLIAFPLSSQAAPASKAKPKGAQTTKEKLVLMPLRLEAELQNMQGAMETALIEGLQQKYIVISGEQVAKKAREIFMKESRNTAKKECDETRCLQGIAESFQSELLATANVTKIEGGYLLALSIRNLYDNIDVYSKSMPCEGCNAFKVVDKLKELVGTPAPIASAPVAEVPAPKITATDPDSITWAEAQNGNTVDDYQVYLDAYPKGKYIAFAKARIKKLKETSVSGAAPILEAPLASGNPNDIEGSLWNGVRSANNIEDYNTYLAQYPKGKFSALAHSLVAKLQDAAADQAWQAANKAGGEAAYQNYLNQYPQGKYAALAKAKLNKLIAEREARETAEEADRWNKADTRNDRAAVEDYLTRYPAGRYLVAANTKLQRLKEEDKAKIIENIATNMVAIPGKNYELGKYEVTQKEWREVMGNNPSRFSNCGDTCPVEQVSWDDIQVFLQKLNQKTGRQYRLPTEEEWEYACYGGLGGLFSSPDYCGGDDINAVAWYDGNSNGTTHPAGQKQANGYGLYDMSGNVTEWMENWYSSSGDPIYGRARRGGSWYSLPQGVYAVYRFLNIPADRSVSFGFRLARTLP